MAVSSLFALLDDIATLLNDVSVMTQTAATKTAGVLGDDLALNAQQVAGVRAERELPVVWAVARGSLWNKAVLVPAALLISLWAPWAVTPLLMLGGAYLCFEGVEKLAHRWLHTPAEDQAHHAELTHALAHPEVDLVALERDKIRGAIRTDFILSAEIIVISLGTVAEQPWMSQAAVLVAIALLMTVGVYGLVAGIVKLDDAGLWLSLRPGRGAWVRLLHRLGALLLAAAPWLMRSLTVLGTAAMFLVGGGILVHGWPWLHHGVRALGTAFGLTSWLATVWSWLWPLLADALAGMVAGAVVLAGVLLVQRLKPASAQRG